jgi:hypothetical protein
LGKIQELLKNNGFNNKTEKESKALFQNMNSQYSLKVKKLLDDYLADLSAKAKENETLCCSSDIIESCFGKYKEVVKGKKSVGISDLCLFIAAMLGEKNPDKTKDSMEKISMKQLKVWKEKNICKTLFAEKKELNKIVERIYRE